MAQRVVNDSGVSLPAAPQHELPLAQPADGVADGVDVDAAGRRAHAVEEAGLVPLGLQAARPSTCRRWRCAL